MATKFAYRESTTQKGKGKHLDHLRIRKAETGGHVVEHHYSENGMVYHKPTEHLFGDDEGKELMAHVAKHAGVNTGEAKEEAVEGE